MMKKYSDSNFLISISACNFLRCLIGFCYNVKPTKQNLCCSDIERKARVSVKSYYTVLPFLLIINEEIGTIVVSNM